MATLHKFELTNPFEYRGTTYTEIEVRRPKVRDLKDFVKNADVNAIAAMEKVIGQLADLDEKVIAEIDLEDFGPMKNWFEAFLKFMSSESDKS